MKNLILKLVLSFLFILVSASAIAEPVKLKLSTTKGDMIMELYPDKAPKTVANFLVYVDKGFFDKTIFHRVIKNFMIQGGGLTEDMQKKATNAGVENEADNGLKNTFGSIAMARTADPHSATAQFFINHKDNSFLNFPGQDGYGYTVFGQITGGLDVVETIANTRTRIKNGRRDVPEKTIFINSITRIGK